MKRLWWGLVLLLVLLLTGIGAQIAMTAIHGPASGDLERAAQAALSEDWDTALPLADGAYERWQRYQKITASISDHTPMDDTQTLFAEMRVYAASRDTAHFAACCAQLAKATRSFADAHTLNWWNML